MELCKIRSEIIRKPIWSKIDSNVPKQISWLVERTPILPTRHNSQICKSNSQSVISANQTTTEKSAVPLKKSNSEQLRLVDSKSSSEIMKNQLERLVRENETLKQLIHLLRSSLDECQYLDQENRRIIAHLELEVRCLREQREFLKYPAEQFRPRERLSDSLEGHLESVPESNELKFYLTNDRLNFEELRKQKRAEIKQRILVKKYSI
ncbi:uncharacterized protein LOC129743824 [Uranotaenia lowii]|uniref:uncharacterized protein LOC129743824 n=1 Tax=Uranotaenia lowii TaxID=190385 RepID=UPI00247B2330|nr:uncharacterized protein LOC129743824 [Uranotaenia lowii]